MVNSDYIFEEEIRKQVLLAVDEADVILFVVDVMNGVTDLDMQVATILRLSLIHILPDKEFRYLRTVIVTAAVYWGFNSMLLLR